MIYGIIGCGVDSKANGRLPAHDMKAIAVEDGLRSVLSRTAAISSRRRGRRLRDHNLGCCTANEWPLFDRWDGPLNVIEESLENITNFQSFSVEGKTNGDVRFWGMRVENEILAERIG